MKVSHDIVRIPLSLESKHNNNYYIGSADVDHWGRFNLKEYNCFMQ